MQRHYTDRHVHISEIYLGQSRDIFGNEDWQLSFLTQTKAKILQIHLLKIRNWRFIKQFWCCHNNSVGSHGRTGAVPPWALGTPHSTGESEHKGGWRDTFSKWFVYSVRESRFFSIISNHKWKSPQAWCTYSQLKGQSRHWGHQGGWNHQDALASEATGPWKLVLHDQAVTCTAKAALP